MRLDLPALVSALLAPPTTAPQDPAPARILVDGDPWSPSWDGSGHIPLTGHGDGPRPGDPIRVGEYWLTLPPGGHHSPMIWSARAGSAASKRTRTASGKQACFMALAFRTRGGLARVYCRRRRAPTQQ